MVKQVPDEIHYTFAGLISIQQGKAIHLLQDTRDNECKILKWRRIKNGEAISG